MRPPLGLLAAALAVAVVAPPAHAAGPARPGAAPPLRVAVVALAAPPQLAFTARAAADALARRAAASGYEVLGPRAVADQLGRDGAAALAACGGDAGCLAERGAALGVERIVGGTLSRRGPAYRVALVSADARTGARLGGAERDVAVASRRLRRDVADAAPALLRGGDEARGVLRVLTEAAGAAVWVDGVPAGKTPAARVVRPGKHEVKVALPGYAEAAPVWVEVPAGGLVEHRPRLYAIPARDRPAGGGGGAQAAR